MNTFNRIFSYALFVAVASLVILAQPACSDDPAPSEGASAETRGAIDAGRAEREGVPVIVFDPPTMEFGDVGSGDRPPTRTVELRSSIPGLDFVVEMPADSPFTCRRIRSSGSGAPGPGSLEVGIAGTSEPGRVEGYLDIVVRDAAQTRLRYRVTADVVGALRIRPDRLRLRLTPGARIEARVDVTPADSAKAMGLTGVALTAPDLALVVKVVEHPSAPNGRRLLVSGVAPEQLADANIGELTFRTEVGGFESVTIPITASMQVGGRVPAKPSVASRPSSLVFAEDHHDFGRIREENGVVRHVFEFRNSGSRPVTIKKVDSSCSCLASRPEKLTYAPGESGSIEVALDPTLRQGQTGRKSITIVSDDPLNPLKSVTVSADIFPRIGLDPVTAYFGEVALGVEAPEPLIVTVTSSVPGFEVVDVDLPADSPFGWKRLAVEKGELSGEAVVRHRFAVTFAGTNRIERLRTFVTLETNDVVRPKISYPLVASVIGPLRIKPEKIFLRSVRGEPFEQVVTIVARSASTSFRVLGCQVDDPEGLDLTATIDAASSLGATTIRVAGTTPATGGAGGAHSATLTISTDVGAQRVIEIPVRVMASGKGG